MRQLAIATLAPLAMSILSGCALAPISGSDPSRALEPSAIASQSPDSDGPFLYTDPPLPTYDLKTPRTTPDRSEGQIPDCFDVDVQVDFYPDVEKLVEMSSAIVVAEFDRYGDARWSTISGERPTRDEYVESDYVVTVVRDVHLRVQDFLRGTAADLTGAYVRGGELGCDRFTFSDIPELHPGDRAVFFTAPLPLAGPGSPQVPLLTRLWWIGSGDELQPFDGPGVGTMRELVQMIETTPFIPHVPPGTPAPSPPR